MALDPRQSVCDQMTAAHLVPPEPSALIVDGRGHSFAGTEKRKKSSWYVLRELYTRAGRAFLVGHFGDHRLGIREKLKATLELAGEDLDAARREIAKMRRVAERQRQELAARAARHAARVWARLAPADRGAAPYLVRKGVSAHGPVRVTPRGALAIPAYSPEGKLTALQLIHAAPRVVEGEARAKDFWPPGCVVRAASCRIGPEPSADAEAPPLVLVEGYATGATCFEATGWPVVICFNAENLVQVARHYAALGPGRVLVAGDDDIQTKGNPGRTKAEEAAAAARGRAVLPVFTARPEGRAATDFNDLHALEGLAAVRAQLEAARPRAPQLEAAPEAPEGSGWRDALQRTPHGVLLPTVANMVLILSHDRAWRGVLAWCDFSEQIVKRAPPPWGGRLGPWADIDISQARHWFSARYRLQGRVRDLEDALAVCAYERHVHPVRDYLTGLNWDGVVRLPTWLADYLGAEEDDYSASVGTLWMIAAVARVMQPGCKADYVLILEGPQGRYKSTALGILGGEWFSDTPLSLRDKDAMQNLPGVWVVELAELTSMQGVSSGRINAFFSSGTDRYRQSYGRRAGDFPRQCVFAGTVNPTSYLSDPTGARRFWPVSCGAVARLGALKQERNQLWAEAYHRWRSGEQWWPREADIARFTDEQEQRFEDDPWQEIIESYLYSPERRKMRYVTVLEVLVDAVCFDASKIQNRDMQRAGLVMQRLGWRKVRSRVTVDGRCIRRNMYERPAEGDCPRQDAGAPPPSCPAPGGGQMH
jgi:putative DNA primase/helicase